MLQSNIASKLATISLYTFYFLLAYMPLHIFLSTWLGTSFNQLEFAKIAKDIVLVIGFLLVLAASIRKTWFKHDIKDKLVLFILMYTGLTLFMAAIKPTDQEAETLGVVLNTRFLMFFLYGWLLARLYSNTNILKTAVKIVLMSGIVVSVFGVFQYTLLPDDALTRVGYSRENGVLPAFFIDDKPDLERVMSTVRDPNSLGSYLIIISSISLALLWAYRTKPNKVQLFSGIAALSSLCILLTFSRSAWLGMVLAAAVFMFLVRKQLWKSIPRKKTVISSLAVLMLVGLGGLFVFRESYFVQNVVFHADDATVLEDPNELRIKFLQESIADIAEEPLGSGPGTAGLASIRNTEQGTILNENYYLQIATEVGIIGLVLFITILVLTAKRLWVIKNSSITQALLIAFVGLAFTNLLVHIWSNEAVAYTWWGLAGLVVLKSEKFKSDIVLINKVKHEKTS